MKFEIGNPKQSETLKSRPSSKKMKPKTDRISILPDFIIHHILSYLLYDPVYLVRMSVLSKRWFNLTTSFPILFFRYDSRFKWFSYFQYRLCEFDKQDISAHSLIINAPVTTVKELHHFSFYLNLLLEKGLEVMNLYFYYPTNMPILRLPNTLLSASSLVYLKLHRCELPSFSMANAVKFNSLRRLSLSDLPIDERVIEYLIEGSPNLKEIFIELCYGFKRFFVKSHPNLLIVHIYADYPLECIDIDAPNLIFFVVSANSDYKAPQKKEPPSMFMTSCKKLTTFCYSGPPLERLSQFLSDFPFIQNLSLNFPPKLSNHSLTKLRLQRCCDLEEIDLDTPCLLVFEYYDSVSGDKGSMAPLLRKHSSMPKGCMKCVMGESLDIIWYQKLRKFLEKNSIFKVLKLEIDSDIKDLEKLKLIPSSPYKLENVELIMHMFFATNSPMDVVVGLVDAALWCCRPRSLSLVLNFSVDTSHLVKYTYGKLLQQEDGKTNIKFVLISFPKDEEHFSDLNSLLKRLSLDQVQIFDDKKNIITFIKEEVVQEVFQEAGD